VQHEGSRPERRRARACAVVLSKPAVAPGTSTTSIPVRHRPLHEIDGR
jgi:hypothetical protein